MDFGKAFTYMFQDPQWLVKLGIGTLLMLVGIILSPVLLGLVPLIIVTGYTLVVVENVRLGRERPLPDWQDWGKFATLGLKLCAAFLVWSLPILACMVPMIVVGILSENSSSEAMNSVAAVTAICVSCLAILWGIFVVLLSPAIYVRLAATERIASAFELGKVWAFTRDNLANVVISLLLVILAELNRFGRCDAGDCGARDRRVHHVPVCYPVAILGPVTPVRPDRLRQCERCGIGAWNVSGGVSRDD